MKQHRYRITLEHLADTKGALPAPKTLQFEVGNHDDLFTIVERMRGRGDFNENTATALVIGLKLFGEVMLEEKAHPLFSSLRPHFAQFMKELKKGPGTASPEGKHA